MAKLHNQVTMRPKIPTLFKAVSGTAGNLNAAFGTHVKTVRLYLSGATADAFFNIDGAATTTSTPIAPTTYYDISIHGGETLSVIGTDGTLYATEMTQ